ncbi:MAG: polysaccharide deacetylase family protein [Caldilinea sp. CFX5]|nr:polysaccharide deacetylase family protein [Caldilinea sp. CFX5]
MLFKYRLHNQICQTLKHYNTQTNKGMAGVLYPGCIEITINKQKMRNVLKRSTIRYQLFASLLLFILLGLVSCRAEQPSSDLTIPSASTPLLPPTAQTIVITTPTAPLRKLTATATPAPATPTHQTLTLLPTATVAAPTIAVTPTLSLVDALSQTVVVTAVKPLSPTILFAHPAPPLVVAPALGPDPTNTVAPEPPVVTAITALQPDGVVRTAHVPILMYHYLSTPPAAADIYRRDLSVPPELFAAHLDRLQADGYTTISLYALAAYLQQGTPLPPKPVILTFDDGYRDNYENAFPLLRDRRMTATFFVVMEFINQGRPEYLTWDMVREMHAGGMSIEVHGVDHTTLRKRSRGDLEFQALRSYETLQDRLGVRPRFLSYPAGEYDADTIAVFQAAGYWAAVTTIQGATHSSDQLFELRRVRIRNTTTADELVRLLSLAW